MSTVLGKRQPTERLSHQSSTPKHQKTPSSKATPFIAIQSESAQDTSKVEKVAQKTIMQLPSSFASRSSLSSYPPSFSSSYSFSSTSSLPSSLSTGVSYSSPISSSITSGIAPQQEMGELQKYAKKQFRQDLPPLLEQEVESRVCKVIIKMGECIPTKYVQCATLNPHVPYTTLISLGESFYSTGSKENYTRAIGLFRRAISSITCINLKGSLHFKIGRCYLFRKFPADLDKAISADLDLAIAESDQGLALKPNDKCVLGHLHAVKAKAYLARNREDDLEQVFKSIDEGFKSGSTSAYLQIDLYIVRAKAYLAKKGEGDLQRVSEALDAASKLEPKNDQLMEWQLVKHSQLYPT